MASDVIARHDVAARHGGGGHLDGAAPERTFLTTGDRDAMARGARLAWGRELDRIAGVAL